MQSVPSRSSHQLFPCPAAFLPPVLMFLISFMVVLGHTEEAKAHRVIIFAWVEQGTVHTESTFGSGRRAQGAAVTATVSGMSSPLARGVTDKRGRWSFPLPSSLLEHPKDIILTLNAGAGHAGTWTVEATEYQATTPPPAATGSESAQATLQPVHHHSHAAHAAPLDEAALRAIIADELEKQLAPIRRELAARQQDGPSMQDILAGIGYIFGLFGVAALVQARKRPHKE